MDSSKQKQQTVRRSVTKTYQTIVNNIFPASTEQVHVLKHVNNFFLMCQQQCPDGLQSDEYLFFPPHPFNRRRRQTILIIENEAVVQGMLCDALQVAGYRILLQDDPLSEGAWVDDLSHLEPDVVLLDISLSRPSPFVYLERVCQRWTKRKCFVILLTTHPFVCETLEKQGIPILLKPFHLQPLFRLFVPTHHQHLNESRTLRCRTTTTDEGRN